MNMQVNAQKIKHLREQRCWSQLQLSEMAGISLRTIQRLEAKSVASQETIKGLAAVFELGCEELLPEKEPVIQQTSSEEISKDKATELNDSVENKAYCIKQKKIEKKRLFIALLVIILANMFGFYSVFTAFAEGKISSDTFSLLKNIVSLSLLISTVLVVVSAYRKGIIKNSDLF